MTLQLGDVEKRLQSLIEVHLTKYLPGPTYQDRIAQRLSEALQKSLTAQGAGKAPNGDGNNDIFYPRGTGLFSIKTLRIFNRWGEVVFEKNGFMPNDAGAGWNGTVKGMKQNPDVFVYTVDILCDNSSLLTLKGNVALIR